VAVEEEEELEKVCSIEIERGVFYYLTMVLFVSASVTIGASIILSLLIAKDLIRH